MNKNKLQLSYFSFCIQYILSSKPFLPCLQTKFIFFTPNFLLGKTDFIKRRAKKRRPGNRSVRGMETGGQETEVQGQGGAIISFCLQLQHYQGHLLKYVHAQSYTNNENTWSCKYVDMTQNSAGHAQQAHLYHFLSIRMVSHAVEVQEGNFPLSFFQEDEQLLQAITQRFMCQVRGLQLDSGHVLVCKNKNNWPKNFH